LILPTGILIQANITSSDVIHRFALPTLSVKSDATAGILNISSFEIFTNKIHKGQCSEICGINHKYIPIVLEKTNFLN